MNQNQLASMSTNYNKISDEVKASVLSALELPGYNLTKIAGSHNISKTTIYTWLREKSSALISNPAQIPAGQVCKQSIAKAI